MASSGRSRRWDGGVLAGASLVAAVVALVGGGAGCTKSEGHVAETAARRGAVPPEVLPSTFDPSEYVGAKACAECHRDAYDAWLRSPHGRSMTDAGEATVLADFDGKPIALAGGTVTPSRRGADYVMDIESGGHHETRKVDLVLASGRQHQIYVTRTADGLTALLPVIYSVKTKEWLPLDLYQPTELDPRSPNYFAGRDMTRGCLSCHVSETYRKIDEGGAATHWIDSSINCESCHGPGREHIRRRREGGVDPYRDLSKVGSVEEARICGGCHGFQLKPYLFPFAADGFPQIFVTSLVNDSLRPDGTQQRTSYQYPGHVLSGGYRLGVLTCKDCHAPHALTARNNHGESAVGEASNRQCTGCHPSMADTTVATRHAHHSPKTRCVDCHMPYSWIGDSDKRRQRTSDHSISIPRPRETKLLGTPNACTTCHTEKSADWALAALTKWKQDDATGVRDWVETIALARKRAPGASERLAQLLDDPKTVTYLKASALDLLVVQTPDAKLVPSIEPYSRDPDPNLRAIAIRALDHHDVANRHKWRQLGFADSHPFVRMETFSLVRDVESLPAEAVAQNLDDVLAYMSPPTDGLQHLVTVHHKRGELRDALDVLDLLERVTLPHERKALGLDGVRARVAAELARREAGH